MVSTVHSVLIFFFLLASPVIWGCRCPVWLITFCTSPCPSPRLLSYDSYCSPCSALHDSDVHRLFYRVSLIGYGSRTDIEAAVVEAWRSEVVTEFVVARLPAWRAHARGEAQRPPAPTAAARPARRQRTAADDIIGHDFIGHDVIVPRSEPDAAGIEGEDSAARRAAVERAERPRGGRAAGSAQPDPVATPTPAEGGGRLPRRRRRVVTGAEASPDAVP